MEQLTVALRIDDTLYEPFVMAVPDPDGQTGEQDAHIGEPDAVDVAIDVTYETGPDPHNGEADSIPLAPIRADGMDGETGELQLIEVELMSESEGTPDM